jgi:putative ABC transport system ATP-binding protein
VRVALRDLFFAYGEGGFALQIPELCVESGSRVAVVGPSGSGKTTILHMIAGILVPERGRVEVGSTCLGDLSEAERRAFRVQTIGAVFQEFELLEYLDVRDNILLPYRISPHLPLTSAVRERAASLAADVGLGDKLDRRPGRLSHGEKQRVAICRAVITEPAILLADEPTGNLDPANKDVVLGILLEQAERSGASLLTVTHDHALLGRFDRVLDVATLQALPRLPQGQDRRVDRLDRAHSLRARRAAGPC